MVVCRMTGDEEKYRVAFRKDLKKVVLSQVLPDD